MKNKIAKLSQLRAKLVRTEQPCREKSRMGEIGRLKLLAEERRLSNSIQVEIFRDAIIKQEFGSYLPF
jgi:hypothetical protein